MTIWEDVLSSLVSMGVVAYAVQYMFQRKLVAYKLKLNKQIEKIKSENQIFRDRSLAAFEIEIEKARASCSEIYKKRLEIFGICHEKLVALHCAVHSYTKMIEYPQDGTKDERYNKVIASGKEFRNFYLPNQLYLTKELEKVIDNLNKHLGKTTVDFLCQVHGRESERETSAKWLEILKDIEEDIDPVLKQHREEMRNILDPPNQFILKQ
jgi:hypothetical protein